MSIAANGTWTSNGFCEASAMNAYYNQYPGDWGTSFTHTPGTGANSCHYKNHVNIDEVGVYHIKLTVSWSGLDESNTAGTFDLSFQGAVLTDETWSFSGNDMVVALNEQQNLKTLVLSADSGTYEYSTTFSVTDSTIKALRLGIRGDYSNGVGAITVSNVEVIHDKYYVGEAKMKVGDDDSYVAAFEFIEF